MKGKSELLVLGPSIEIIIPIPRIVEDRNQKWVVYFYLLKFH